MRFDIFLKGKIVDLVRVTKSIILKTDFYTWLNDQTITKFTAQGYIPISRKEEVEYFEKNIKSKTRLQLGVINKKTSTLIGMMSLYDINHYTRSCEISALFNKNDTNINSMSYFKEAQTLLIDHAFNKLNLRRIGAASNGKNLVELNKKLFGFEVEGVLKNRDHADGKYVDRYVLTLFRKDWS